MVTCRKCHAGMASLYCRVTPLQDGTKVEEIACRRCGDVLESRPILLEMRRPVERGLMQPGRPRLPVRQLLSVKKSRVRRLRRVAHPLRPRPVQRLLQAI